MRIAICDSDKNQIRHYKQLLEKLGKKHDVLLEVNQYTTNERLIFDLEAQPHKVDLVFLEVNFDENIDGIEAAHKLRSFNYINEIIFLTNAKDRIFEAFDVEALHFLIKDQLTEKRFEEIFLLAKEKIEKKDQEVIVLSCANESRSIPLNDISYFEFHKRLIKVHYKGGEFEFYSTLGKLENLLCPKGFVRVHKAFLVSTKVIQSIVGADINLRDGSVLPLSRTYSKQVRAAFSELSRAFY